MKSTVAQLIEQLKSPNKDRRYEACEKLRVMESVPAEALAALEAATHDPDRYVAEVARHALDVQMSGPPVQETASAQAASGWGRSLLAILLGAVADAGAAFLTILVGGSNADPRESPFGGGLGLIIGACYVAPLGFFAGLAGSAIAMRAGRSMPTSLFVGLIAGVIVGLAPLLL